MKLNLPGGNIATGSKTVSGTEPDFLELSNKNGVKITFSPVGAALVSLCVPDKYGNVADIVLGYDHNEQYLSDEFYLGTVVGRYANRIAGHQVTIDNREYTLRSKKEDFHHHGGIEGFNKKIFEGHLFTEDGVSGVAFSYTSPHLEEGYPGEFQLTVKYLLTDNNEWIVEYTGVSDKTTIVNLTQHAYFNLAGHATGNTDAHLLQIFADGYLPVNHLQVPRGVIAPVSGTAFDFTKLRPIGSGQDISNEQLLLSGGYDHSFILESEHTASMKKAVLLQDPGSGRTMEVWTTEPSVHFYAGNFLENVQGKQGAVYQQRGGLCFETQHFPDSPNHPSFPSVILHAGERFYSKTVFKFSG